ncbi:MAG TPA: cupin domain-containing protein [Ramlibacter sp.]|uniref:cupin domain-containing protein n=1 Tax=Ramlibacter sp. TaxID=1917967 RepID=UPI002C686332|nr:cupin domain-containing protein [Ramlibacter sp.]HVZ44241.1 cupin domain-containing protein [Ramlibacter sp.]
MSKSRETGLCDWADRTAGYAMQTLHAAEVGAVERHIESCPRCSGDLQSLRPVIAAFAAWPRDVLRPDSSLRRRLAERIAAQTGEAPVLPAHRPWVEPRWSRVAPGIECHVLSQDEVTHMVSMLVRLAPGADYPPHTHRGVEELHLLAGELWIDGRKLMPGDYNRAEPGTGDKRVWSESGCTCMLVTSARDVLG